MRLIDANKFQETLDKVSREPEYQHEGEDWRSGLCLAGCLLDQEPTVDSLEDYRKQKFYDFVNFLGLLMTNQYEESSDESYKEAIRDISFEICKYLEPQGIPLNRTPLTAEYLDSNDRKEFLRGKTNEN